MWDVGVFVRVGYEEIVGKLVLDSTPFDVQNDLHDVSINDLYVLICVWGVFVRDGYEEIVGKLVS